MMYSKSREGKELVGQVEELMDFIFSYGRPKELWVSNIIVEAALDQICDVAEISLKRARSLPNVEEFIEGMRRF